MGITTYNANADLFLQDHERNKFNRQNNRRTFPPISGDEIIGDLIHNQMLLTQSPRWPWKILTNAMSKPLWYTPTSYTATKTI
jgi:hypothetical protein